MAKKDKDEAVAQDEPAETSIAVNDAWTGMLAISLLALMVGSGFLLWDYLSYPDDPPKVQKILPPGGGGAPAKVDPAK